MLHSLLLVLLIGAIAWGGATIGLASLFGVVFDEPWEDIGSYIRAIRLKTLLFLTAFGRLTAR